MKKLTIFLLAILFLTVSAGKVLAVGQVEVVVDPTKVKTEDFAQILGGYLGTKKQMLSSPLIIDAAKKMFPRSSEFPNGAVMRTQSAAMKSDDYFVTPDTEIEEVIKFCSLTGCDPMFGAIGEGEEKTIAGQTGRVIDSSPTAIKKRAEFVKQKCRQYFKDDKHCLHWDIGNEPPTTPANCGYYGNTLIPESIKAVKEVFPNAIIHAPELFLDTAKVRETNMTVGECIIQKVNQKDKNLKIDVVTTHWYPYICGSENKPSALGVTGNAVLSWNGFGSNIEKMTYPYDIVRSMSSWMNKYEVSKNSVIGIGELNPMASCMTSGMAGGSLKDQRRSTEILNLTWGGGFWHLDILGNIADAGIKYVQRHVHVGSDGGQYTPMILSGGKVIKTPVYYAYYFYSNYFGRKVVESISNQKEILNSHTAVDRSGNLRILLINKSGGGSKTGLPANSEAQTIKVKIKINNFSALDKGEAYFFKAPGTFLEATANENNIFSTKTNIPVSNDFVYEVPAYTAVILKIPSKDGGGEEDDNNNDLTTLDYQRAEACPAGKPSRETGNANCDTVVNTADFTVWKNELLGKKTQGEADFNGDGIVDGFDFMIWLKNK